MFRRNLIALSMVVAMFQACKDTVPLLPSAGTIVKVDELRSEPVSGSRLRARVLDLGATDLLLDWWDRELDLACKFVAAADGEIRCLPSAVSSETSVGGNAGEERCVQVVASERKGPVRILANPGGKRSEACNGAPVWDAYELKVSKSGSSCPYGGNDGDLVLGKRLPLERFVRAVEVSEHTDARLGLSVLLAEDGARQVLAAHDQQLNESCDVHSLHEGSLTCVPTSALTNFVYFDDRCSGEPGYFTFSEPACKSHRTAFDGDKVYSLHGPLEPPFSYYLYDEESEDEDGPCGKGSPNDFLRVYRQGEPLNTMTLDAGYLGKPIGMRFLFADKKPLSPVQSTYTRHWVGSDYGVGWDHERDEGCRFLPMSNGDWICLPNSVPTLTSVHFEDAKCTKPVITWADPGRALLQRAVNGFLSSFLLREGLKIIDVGEEVDAPYYYLHADGKCERDGHGFRRFVDAVEDLPRVLSVEQR